MKTKVVCRKIVALIATVATLSVCAKSKSSDDDDVDFEGDSYSFSLADEVEYIGDYDVLTEFLPSGVDVEWTGKKFKTPKAGKIKYSKDEEAFVDKRESENPSGLKLKYSKKSDKVTGSFKVYCQYENKKGKLKLKTYKAKVSGYLSDESLNVKVKGVMYSATLD